MGIDELERTLGTRLMLLEFTGQVAAHLDETLQGTSCPCFLGFTSSKSAASFPVVLGDDVTCQACLVLLVIRIARIGLGTRLVKAFVFTIFECFEM